MSNRRERNRKNVVWTQGMLNDLKSGKEEAIAQKASDDPPRKANGRTMGYMDIIKNIWNEKGYSNLGLTSQNLADILNQNKRKVVSQHSEVAVTVAREINIAHSEDETINDLNYDRNAEIHLEDNRFDDLLLKKLVDEANVIFESIVNVCGNMNNRLWNTKFKNVPVITTVDYMNKVCYLMIEQHRLVHENDCKKSLWILNCLVYSSIAAWIVVNDIKGMEVNKVIKNCNRTPKEVSCIDDEIKQTRGFISKCVAEKSRLVIKGRLTRKTKRNRNEISKHCEVISVYSLTCLIAQRKKRLKYLAKRRKRKIKQIETKLVNKQFNENQSRVFNKFQEAIDRDPENLQPEYIEKDTMKEQKYFENSKDVETFWRSLWEADDKGNPKAEWLNTFRKIFEDMVPDTDVDVNFNEKDCFDNIRTKKNWSAPGPDRIVNFWWKKLSLVKFVYPIFLKMIWEGVHFTRWFCRGRTGLIPKDGVWSIPNQRPITCLNNMYKWLTSIIKMKSDEHLKKYDLMQVDQRGACEGVSGTVDNLMVDDMVQRDAILNKRNLFTTWIDVKKAFDSVSHSFLVEVLKIHRFPDKIVTAVKNIIGTWNIVLVIPLKEKSVETEPIELKNGELQGDTFCPNLYTLCNNLVSWVIRSFKGYMLSKPIKEKATHALFIDDLKNYWASPRDALIGLNTIKVCMRDCGLEWNESKCKGCFLKRGKFCEHEDLILDDEKKIECLKEGETYKFMGVYQSTQLDKDGLESSLMKTVEQRAHVIWKSSLYDVNKVLATNTFVNGSVEYYFWSCNMRIDFLKQLDRRIRGVMNRCGAKHTNIVNESLYLPRCKGGRGLKSLENAYKDIKVKAAMKLKVNKNPRMKLVNRFHQLHLNTNSYSLFKEAQRYCNEKGLQSRFDEEMCSIAAHEKDISSTDENCLDNLKKVLRSVNDTHNLETVLGCSWQGVIPKTILEDETLVSKNYFWLSRWKSCPTSTITELMNLLYQTLNTMCYKKHTVPSGTIVDTTCRLCGKGEESVMHLLSNCGMLVKHVFVERHNNALKCFFFQMLRKFKFIEEIPPWFSPVKVKPEYENDEYTINWDIPEYSGRDGETIRDSARPDGKLVMKKEKKIYLIEQTVPWISNRDAKYDLKSTKYSDVQSFLRLENPGYEVGQITLVMDVFGGYSRNLSENLEKVLDKDETKSVITKMQKSVVSSEAHLVRVFKVRTF